MLELTAMWLRHHVISILIMLNCFANRYSVLDGVTEDGYQEWDGYTVGLVHSWAALLAKKARRGNGAPLEKRTLTSHYNARPDWLDEAHWQIDCAVLDAYGWPHGLTDDEILARLPAVNLERAAAQGEGNIFSDEIFEESD
jgi:hypothetical protein